MNEKEKEKISIEGREFSKVYPCKDPTHGLQMSHLDTA